MSIPKAVKCRHCGRRVLFVTAAVGGRLPVDADMVGYRCGRLEPGERGERLYRADGTSFTAAVVDDELADDFAHRAHWVSCSKRPVRTRA